METKEEKEARDRRMREWEEKEERDRWNEMLFDPDVYAYWAWLKGEIIKEWEKDWMSERWESIWGAFSIFDCERAMRQGYNRNENAQRNVRKQAEFLGIIPKQFPDPPPPPPSTYVDSAPCGKVVRDETVVYRRKNDKGE